MNLTPTEQELLDMFMGDPTEIWSGSGSSEMACEPQYIAADVLTRMYECGAMPELRIFADHYLCDGVNFAGRGATWHEAVIRAAIDWQSRREEAK